MERRTIIFGGLASLVSKSLDFLPLHTSNPPSNTTLNQFTDEETTKIEELKARLTNDGFGSETIDSLFDYKNLEIYRRIGRLFIRNPENNVDLVDTPEKFEERYKKGYRKQIRLDDKIESAQDFAKKHSSDLEGAESENDVDRRVIVGILGIESDFGKVTGKYKAFNSFVSQYLVRVYKNDESEKRRKDRAYREIKKLIEYSKRTGIQILKLNSSYAGAIGYGQFIPSSLNEYFVGKNGTVEEADPTYMVDTIYAVANYLHKNRWNKTIDNQSPKVNEMDWWEINDMVRKLNKNRNEPELLDQISANNPRNWFSIWNYNHSTAYIKAVLEIADSIKI